MNEYRSSASVPSDHPCLPGHFPGNPVVPGVLILQLVAEAVCDWRGSQATVGRFGNVKFISLLRPGEIMDIVLQGEASQLRFRCECAGRLLSHGSLELAAQPA